MAMTPLTREQAEAAWHLVQKHGAVWTAASAIGIPESTLAKRYNAAIKSGGVQVTVKKMKREKGAVQVEVDWMDAADTLCSAIYDARQLKPHEEASDG